LNSTGRIDAGKLTAQLNACPGAGGVSREHQAHRQFQRETTSPISTWGRSASHRQAATRRSVSARQSYLRDFAPPRSPNGNKRRRLKLAGYLTGDAGPVLFRINGVVEIDEPAVRRTNQQSPSSNSSQDCRWPTRWSD
jgi:hypothetical protein